MLCAVDDEGYMNVLEVADGHLHVGYPVEDYGAAGGSAAGYRVPPLRVRATVWRNRPMDRVG